MDEFGQKETLSTDRTNECYKANSGRSVLPYVKAALAKLRISAKELFARIIAA